MGLLGKHNTIKEIGNVKTVTARSRKSEVFPEDRVVLDPVTSKVQKQSRNYRLIDLSFPVYIQGVP